MNLSLAVFDGFHILSLMKIPMEDAKKQYADIAVQYSLPENCWLVHISIVLIIELKDDEFRHADLSQLNAYVSYFKENEMNEGDNPPVGILLCTRKGEKMVEYALAGMDNNLFVSTYMLSLPDKQMLQDFLLREIQS